MRLFSGTSGSGVPSQHQSSPRWSLRAGDPSRHFVATDAVLRWLRRGRRRRACRHLMFRLIFGLVAMPVLLLETAVLRSQLFAVGAIGNVLVYPLILLVSIAVHEAGHALVGHATGLR